MDVQIILKMVEPYVKDGSITYDEFDEIFFMLSKKEQYAVTDILAEHGVELRVSEKDLDDLFQADDEVFRRLEEGELPDGEEDNEADLDVDLDLDYVEAGNRPAGVLLDEEDDAAWYYADEFEDEDEEEEEQDEEDSLEDRPYKKTPLYSLDLFGGNDIKDYALTLGKDIKSTNEMLIRYYQQGHKQALEDLCVKNQKLVMKYALRYTKYNGCDLSEDDLFLAGMCGLLKAATKFNPDLGYSFSTYAVNWIKQMITREIADHGFTIRIPVHMYERILKVARLESQFVDQGLSSKERIEAVSKALKETNTPLSEAQVAECIRLREQLMRCTSLDVPVGEDADSVLGDYVPTKRDESTEAILYRMSLRAELTQMVKQLSPREQNIISDRFGLEGQKIRTLEDIGTELDLTRERVRQIEAKALKKLQKMSSKIELSDYIEEMARWQ